MECRLISIWTRASRNALAALAGGGADVVVVTPPAAALRLVAYSSPQLVAFIAETKNSCATFGLRSTSAGKSAGESPA